MGWNFTRGATKAQIVAQILKPWDYTVDADWAKYSNNPEGTHITSLVLKHKITSDGLWVIRQTTKTLADGTTTQEKWIGLSLLENHGGWGHKDMEESMGPNYYSCPVEWFDEVPEPAGEYAAGWRAKCRIEHDLRMRSIHNTTTTAQDGLFPALI